jgi:PEP-CTERM motif
MKKSLLLGILGLAAAVATSFGQGTISLDNYDSTTHPLVKYGSTADGAAGAALSLNSGYTIGIYYVNTAGNFVSSFSADSSPTPIAMPTSLYSGSGTLVLGTGTGAKGGIGNSDTGTAGEYAPPQAFNPGLGEGATVTVMLIAYKGGDGTYAGAAYRGHSTAFTMTTSTGSAIPPYSGNSETDGGFQVFQVPEPSIFALGGLGAAALMLIRRKK